MLVSRIHAENTAAPHLSPSNQTLLPSPRSMPDNEPTQSVELAPVVPRLKLPYYQRPGQQPQKQCNTHLSELILHDFPPQLNASAGGELHGNEYNP